METMIGILYYILINSGGGGINVKANLRKTPAGSPKHKWADNIKTDITEII
jgi:hypothetical protein